MCRGCFQLMWLNDRMVSIMNEQYNICIKIQKFVVLIPAKFI